MPKEIYLKFEEEGARHAIYLETGGDIMVTMYRRLASTRNRRLARGGSDAGAGLLPKVQRQLSLALDDAQAERFRAL